jgi:hypothetical protein
MRTRFRSKTLAFASLGFAAAALAAALGACNADPGVDDLPTLGRPTVESNDGGAAVTVVDGGDIVFDATTPDGALSTTVVCTAFAYVRCRHDDGCTQGVSSLVHYGDQATCEVRRTAECLTELGAAGTAATATTVLACTESITSQTCVDTFDEVPTTACAPLAGALTTGAACLTSSQCASTYCAVAPNETCGSCAEVPKAGDACTTVAQCGERGGLTCAGGVCIPIATAGAACDLTIPCGFGLVCTGATATAAGTCQPYAADAGAACDPSNASTCNAALGQTCDPTSKTCIVVAFADAGAPCGALDGGLVQCAAGQCVLSAADASASATDASADAPTSTDAAADGAADDAGIATQTDAASSSDASVPMVIQAAALATGSCLGAVKEGVACNLVTGPSCLPPAECEVAGDGGTTGTCMLPSAMTCK